MARLPSMQYLMQQTGGHVTLFEDGSEREVVRFDPSSVEDTAAAMAAIGTYGLSEEDESFAYYFWGMIGGES